LRTDTDKWMPLSVYELYAIFSKIPVTWCFAGGWALDLYFGRQTRTHEDIDVIILREDQLPVFQHLKKNWQLYKAEKGRLTLWEEGEYLSATKDIWVSKDNSSPFAFQIMIIDVKQDFWVYRREQSVQRPITDVMAETKEGIPYLKPEIQLLYKGGGSEIREKDHHDFETICPVLTTQAREWLKASLKKQFPEGHVWFN